jgi:hypothetical protein
MTSADRCPRQNVGQPKEFSGRVTVCLSLCFSIKIVGHFPVDTQLLPRRAELPLIYLRRLSTICYPIKDCFKK